jgi:hypothetical protein
MVMHQNQWHLFFVSTDHSNEVCVVHYSSALLEHWFSNCKSSVPCKGIISTIDKILVDRGTMVSNAPTLTPGGSPHSTDMITSESHPANSLQCDGVVEDTKALPTSQVYLKKNQPYKIFIISKSNTQTSD